MAVTVAADFFTTEVWTMRGLVRYHTFFVIRLDTKEVKIAHIGCQINGQVMCQVTTVKRGYINHLIFFG